MIAGYAASTSVGPGERLVLHVATDATHFRVRFYRYGNGLIPMQVSPWLAGDNAAGAGPADDWNWPCYRFWLPRAWPSAVYIAHLQQAGTDGDADADACAPPDLASTSAALLFVVRGSGRGNLLYKLPTATYQAYNHTGGGCFYDAPPRSLDPPGARVSFRRPGGGIGGHTFGAPDYYDTRSPRQTFAHWDAPFIGWLSRNGYRPEFCTDLDLHHNQALLQHYRLMFSVGHDEYWSTPMRDAVEHFVGAGGNVAFFSANLCWWRVHIVEHGAAMVCHQGGPHGALDHWWPDRGASRPEDALCGVSYRHGGGWWDGPRANTGYRVQLPGHWAFAGTGLQRGDTFGQHSSPPLVGYECDGAPLHAFDHASGIATLSPLAQAGGTPPGFALLAAAALNQHWQERPAREPPCMPAHRTQPPWACSRAVAPCLLRAPPTRPRCSAAARTAMSSASRTTSSGTSSPTKEATMTRTDASQDTGAACSEQPWLQADDTASLLIFRALQLGDMLCAVPALRALRAALPATRITLVGLPWATEFAARFERYIDEFIVFPGHPDLPEQTVREELLPAFYSSMRARRFCKALQLHGSGQASNAIVGAFGARAMAGFCPQESHSANGKRFFSYPDTGPEPLRLLSLTNQLVAPALGSGLEFPLTDADERELAASGVAAGLAPNSYICIHPGARTSAKCWPAQRFAEVADQLCDRFNLRTVLTGTPAEAPLTQALARHMRNKALDAAAPLSIGAMAALMNRSRRLISNDTGVSHIAAGLRLASVVVFSKADIRRWAPLNQRLHRSLWDPQGALADVVLEQAAALLTQSALAPAPARIK